MIAHVRSVVTRAARSLKCGEAAFNQASSSDIVVDARYARDVNRSGVENRLTSCHRRTRRRGREFRPRPEGIEDRRSELPVTRGY